MSSDNFQQDIGDAISKTFYNAITKTWNNRISEQENDFRSVRSMEVSGYHHMGIHSDGIGTKVIIADFLEKYSFLGHDLVAMVCDDVTAMGATPIMMSTILDLGNIEKPQKTFPWSKIEELVEGLIYASNLANTPIVSGETAQLGSLVGGNGALPLIFNASVSWLANPGKLIYGDQIKPGDVIIGLEETGCRSNGFTKIREMLGLTYTTADKRWLDKKCSNGKSYGELAIQPSRIYTPLIQPLLQSECKITGMIHVTGGGLAGRLKSYLGKFGLGAEINNPYPPGELFRVAINEGWVSPRVAYNTWCMGNGFLIITHEDEVVSDFLAQRGVESKNIGYVTSDKSVSINQSTSLIWS